MIPKNPDLEPLVLRGIGSAVGWNVASLRYQAQALLATFFAELSGFELSYVTARLVEQGISPVFVNAAVQSMRSGELVPLPTRLPPAVNASGTPARAPGGGGGGTGILFAAGAAVVLILALR